MALDVSRGNACQALSGALNSIHSLAFFLGMMRGGAGNARQSETRCFQRRVEVLLSSFLGATLLAGLPQNAAGDAHVVLAGAFTGQVIHCRTPRKSWPEPVIRAAPKRHGE